MDNAKDLLISDAIEEAIYAHRLAIKYRRFAIAFAVVDMILLALLFGGV